MSGSTSEVTTSQTIETTVSGVRFTGRQLARNSLYNLLGFGLPMVVAVISVPTLIEQLGGERFGLLSIAWLVVGYFNLFDFGIGLAITKLVAEFKTTSQPGRFNDVAWTSISTMATLGVIAGCISFLISPWIVQSMLNVPDYLHGEAEQMLLVLAGAVPVMLLSICFRSILEGDMQFGITNAIKLPMSILTFVGPMAVAVFASDLTIIAIVLLATRCVAMAAYALVCFTKYPLLRRPTAPNWSTLVKLIKFGGWIAVSSVVSPILVYSDRFMIGALVTLQAVTLYVTPYELVTRLSIVPASLAGVLFPVFSSYGEREPKEVARLYAVSVRYLLAALVPLVLLLIGFAEPVLGYWVGKDFVGSSVLVMQVLSFGILVNSLARMPYGLLQASGRPDLTAKLHLCELPIYLGLAGILVMQFGIIGAAIAWSIRVTVDLIALEYLAYRYSNLRLGTIEASYYRRNGIILAAILSIIAVFQWQTISSIPLAIILTLSSGATVWQFLLTKEDRLRVAEYVRTGLSRLPPKGETVS